MAQISRLFCPSRTAEISPPKGVRDTKLLACSQAFPRKKWIKISLEILKPGGDYRAYLQLPIHRLPDTRHALEWLPMGEQQLP